MSDQTAIARIFEYLLAVKNLNEKIPRSISAYEKVWWQKDLPNRQGCFLYGTGTIETAWLEVHKQKIPAAPKPPVLVKEWIEDWEDPTKLPKRVSQTDEKLQDDQERLKVYKDWLEKKWKPWSEEATTKLAIQSLYDQLFTIYQQIQRDGDDLEMTWGHGLLNWEFETEAIQRHLLVTKMELQFRAKRGIFALVPTSKGKQMETDMLLNLPIPNLTEIMEMDSQLTDPDLDLWNEQAVGPLLEELVHTFSANGTYSNDIGRPTDVNEEPVITYSPAIILRKSGTSLWLNELNTAIEKIKNGYPVPNIIKQLTTYDQEIDLEHAAEKKKEWEAVGGNLLFPLETNNEQRLIAKKLAEHDGVLVQGPPGTGKSHTIANLISHLLAHGKRVLVTSEKERALQVIRDKIPEQIRALCVSVLGGDARSVQEIEDSIKHIADSLDNKQPEILDKNVRDLTKEMETTKEKIANWDDLINKIAEKENEKVEIGAEVYTPLEASKWLIEHQAYNGLPDVVTLSDPYPLSEQENKTFFQLLGEITTEERASFAMYRPRTNELVEPPVFERAATDFAAVEQKAIEMEKYIIDWKLNGLKFTFSIEEKRDLTIEIMEKLNHIREAPWQKLLLHELVTDPTRLGVWTDFYQETYDRVETIESLTKELIEDEISVATDQNTNLLIEDLQAIEARLAEDKSIGWLFQNIVGRKYNYIFETCTINGLPIRHKEDVVKIRKYLEKNVLIQKLVLKWNRTMQEYQGPLVEEIQNRLSITVKLLLDDMEKILTWDRDVIEKINPIRDEVGIPKEPVWDSLDWFTLLEQGLTAILAQQKRDEAKQIFQQTMEYLYKESLNANAHPLLDQLIVANREKDPAKWKVAWNELKRLENAAARFAHFQELKKRLQAVAPVWVEELEQQGGQGKVVTPPLHLKEAWKWQQLSAWVEEVHNRPSLEEIEENLQLEKKKEIRLIKELVATSTWKAQIERTTTEQKRSLFAWTKAIQRIGKGTGKYTDIYRKEASKEMATARGAIPVWIMPIKSVIENLALIEDQFDVVIVDESSQSNLFSLSALLRGKKAVIVGDDNQISPESVGTDIGEVHELIERYLSDVPNKLQFEMRTSLYDTASRVFDSKIILKEHFRSVPEIIQFSNDFMYDGMIDPLRLPLGKGALDPPVSAARVEGGHRNEKTKKAINEPEAEAIVAAIAKACADPRYLDKTMGVISLQGHDQAKLIEGKLRDTIGEEEMVKRKLLCGDAYSFQGDERDVMYLSLVAAPNVRIGVMTSRSAYQRFNVAASRARDQMILFHSVDLADLNPEGARYKLLKYCQNPVRAQDEIGIVDENFDSKLEEDIYGIIKAKGYRVVPQVHVGTVGKKIDLVVEGMRNRLAIECDGDHWHGLEKWKEDMDRQRVLERVGWTFWRIRGSDFYLDREKSLEPLWEKLDEMGIEKIQ
ncbi:ATPase AAA [Paraliobacillus quinghaiensis]|uniref:ATPase AAA n=1 Tax=Paraliobacillus quinghaiensis TaxID=470815 RepID=A0A917WYX7_9BACI|nr:AAA domain-containing protein [Paraliobacillus quinghaiensis]GGM42426.1 ATPase AAA [Paraliobacillus quinghaiensis]